MSVPVPLKTIRFRLDDDGVKLFADVMPIGDDPLPQASDIQQQLEQDSFADHYLYKGAIDGLLKLARQTSKPVHIEIGERRDASYTIDIADDGMQAWLTIEPAWGGEPVNQQGLESALESAGISYGLDNDAIQQALQQQQAERLLIARGKAPLDGEDSRFEILFEENIDRKPEIDEKGRANYHALGNIVSVEPGEAVMRRYPPTEGVPGITVTSDKIATQPGENILFAAGLKGVQADKNDPNLLIANITGHPVALANGVNVDNLYIIDNADLTSGNITFEGSIKINHDVRQGVTITADGDIFIGGTVEAATLEASGSIEISGGVIGHLENQDEETPRHWSTRIQAGKSLRLQFAENAQLLAGNNITIAEVVTRCELTAEDSILVGSEGCKKGYVLGGVLRANHKIQAVAAGSPASIQTHLHVGFRIPDTRLQIDTLRKEITLKEQLLEKLAELVRRLQSGQMHDTGGLLEQARNNDREVRAAIAQRQQHIAKQQAYLESLMAARIQVGQRLYTNVYAHIGQEEYRVGDECPGGQFQLIDGKVIFQHDSH